MRKLTFAFMLSASPVAAQQPMICHPIAEFEAALKREYAEEQVGAGVRDDGIELRIYAAPSGSWTALLVRQGVGCAVSVGDAWRPAPARSRGA